MGFLLQFTDDKCNDSSIRKGIPLDALDWFGRGYELHTQKSVGREGSKAWALSVGPSFFSLPAACRLFSLGVIFTRAHVSLALLSLRKNGGLLVAHIRYWTASLLAKVIFLLRFQIPSPVLPIKPEQNWMQGWQYGKGCFIWVQYFG